MSWNLHDSLGPAGAPGRGPRLAAREQEDAVPGTFPGMAASAVPTAVPTVAEEMSWGADADEAEEDALWHREHVAELEASGLVSPRQWAAWSWLCRRGIREGIREAPPQGDEDDPPEAR
jgi:hypothetical protein